MKILLASINQFPRPKKAGGMCSNAKLLLIALCGALISANLTFYVAGAETQAYRGLAQNGAAAQVQQQQQAASAALAGATQATASKAAQAVLAQAAAFRDSE